MNQIANIVSSLTPQAREALRQELDRQDPRESSDFVAVIGAAVRLPGAITSLEKLWEFLARGGDAVGPVPGPLARSSRQVRECAGLGRLHRRRGWL